MRIVVDNQWAIVEGASDAQLLELTQVLTFKDPNPKYDPRYIYGSWDGCHYLFDYENRRFLSGLVDLVLDQTSMEGSEVVYLNKPTPIYWDKNPEIIAGKVLRHYQVSGVDCALRNGGGILQLPTGSGKTPVLAAILKAHAFHKALVVINSKLLLEQTSSELKSMLAEPIGKIGDGVYTLGRVTVATVQSLNNLDPTDAVFEGLDVLVIDEAHHASANSFQAVVRAAGAPYRYGLSGSPFKSRDLTRYEDWILLGLVGEVVYEISTSQLVEEGFLARPEIYFIDLALPRNGEYSSWTKAYTAAITGNKGRNEGIVEVTHSLCSLGLSPLILVTQVKHAAMLFKLLVEQDVKAVFLKGGNVSKDYRGKVSSGMEALDKYKEGKYDCIVATTVLDEGVDVPGMDALIIAGSGKSNIKVIQRLGRVLRAKAGNNTVIVVDFWDGHHNWFKSQSKDRIHIYEEEGHDTMVIPRAALISKFERLLEVSN